MSHQYPSGGRCPRNCSNYIQTREDSSGMNIYSSASSIDPSDLRAHLHPGPTYKRSLANSDSFLPPRNRACQNSCPSSPVPGVFFGSARHSTLLYHLSKPRKLRTSQENCKCGYIGWLRVYNFYRLAPEYTFT